MVLSAIPFLCSFVQVILNSGGCQKGFHYQAFLLTLHTNGSNMQIIARRLKDGQDTRLTSEERVCRTQLGKFCVVLVGLEGCIGNL